MKYLFLVLALVFPIAIFASNSDDLRFLQEENKKIEEELASIQKEMSTLEGQINYLNKKLEQEFINKQILSSKLIDLKNQLLEKIEEKGEVIDFKDIQKEKLERLILDLWREEIKYETSGELNIFKIIFSSFGFETSQKEKRNIERIEKMNEKILQGYENLIGEKDEEIDDIQSLKSKIAKVELQISENGRDLIDTKNAKETLLVNYKEKEGYFNKKLEENKKSMLLSLLEVKKVLISQKEIEERITKVEKESFINEVNEYSESEEIESSGDPYDASRFQSLEDNEFIWPVDPQRGITANFLDSDYEARFGIKHYAIDIRAKQGTAVFAAANSFVYKVVDGGLDYSYVILAHKGSIQTVYGHLSKINVKEGQIIFKGDVIGFSGGMPGTPGAGNLTTGPHLHFEFHRDGSPVNPIDFLPEF